MSLPFCKQLLGTPRVLPIVGGEISVSVQASVCMARFSYYYCSFYLRNPETNDKIGDGNISDLWLGLKNECCHKRNMYAIQYPPGATDAMKKTLIGTALLVDITVFEQEQD